MADISHNQAAWAQIGLSMLYTIGLFSIIIIVITGHASIPPDSKDIVNSILTLLTGGQVIIIGYWFSRQRQTADELAKEPPV